MPFSLNPEQWIKDIEGKAKNIEKDEVDKEILFQWTYLPPRWLGFLRIGLIPILVIFYFVLSRYFDNFLPSYILYPLIAVVTFAVNRIGEKATPKEYAITEKGVYIRKISRNISGGQEVKRKEVGGWQVIGIWREFLGYERSSGKIILKKRARFSRNVVLFYNGGITTSLKITEWVNRYIGRIVNRR
jgi:hypothetical protein